MTTVLVADDDADIRELVAFKLELAGYRVVAVPDGEAALASVDAERPDLLLLDVMMPRVTGIEVCRQLRAREGWADVPILMLTAKAQEADVQRGFDVGADDYIVKPFSPRELVRRVQVAVERSGR
jgi:DNA-binding response OmpR family regulator